MFITSQYDYDRAMTFIDNSYSPESACEMIRLANNVLNLASAGKICTSCSLMYKSCTDYIELYTDDAIYELHMYYIKVRRFSKGSLSERSSYGFYPENKAQGRKWFRFLSGLMRKFKPFNDAHGTAADEIMRLYGV